MHQFNVFHVTVIVIISSITIASIHNCTWLVDKDISIAYSLVALQICTFNLIPRAIIQEKTATAEFSAAAFTN